MEKLQITRSLPDHDELVEFYKKERNSKELEPFLETNKEKLELLFLPPYTPNLNPME